MSAKKGIPVTVLSGFLGAGKTTMLNNLLKNMDRKKITVIVNDMSSINIDAKLIKRTEEKMIEMSNGCICCTLREDLLEQLAEIADENATDYIVIESTGIAEPVHIAETFAHAETLDHIKGHIRLDTMITVVDMQTFFIHFNDNVKMYNSGGGVCTGTSDGKSSAEASALSQQPSPEERTLSHLLIDQVQFADIVVLNKMDCVSAATVTDITGIVRDLNPLAKIMTSSREQQVDPLQFIDTGLFSFQKAEENAQWFAEDWADGTVPESEEYSISAINFTSQEKPFHPARLLAFFDSMTSKVTPAPEANSSTSSKLDSTEVTHSKYGRLLRSKGFVWLATRHDRFWLLHHTGGSLNLQRGGKWWAEVDPSQWPGQEEREERNREKASLAKNNTNKKKRTRLEKEEREDEFYQEVIKRIETSQYGDRAQTLVLIGQHLDKEGVRRELQKCLLTDEEFSLGPEGWGGLPDPLPMPPLPESGAQASQVQTDDQSSCQEESTAEETKQQQHHHQSTSSMSTEHTNKKARNI
jgi:G3E family GTPase